MIYQLPKISHDGIYEEIDIIYQDLEDTSGPDPPPISSFSESNVDPEESEEWEYSQLVPGTPDGFYEKIDSFYEEAKYQKTKDEFPCDMEPLSLF